MLSKTQKRALGAVLVVFGVSSIAGAYYASGDFVKRQKDSSESYTVAMDKCVERIGKFDFDIIAKDKRRIIFGSEGLESPVELLGKSTGAIVSCSGWELERFCMGDEENCQVDGGLRATIKLRKGAYRKS